MGQELTPRLPGLRDGWYEGAKSWEYEMVTYSPCVYTNHWLQIGSAASPPSQEQQEMAPSCTQGGPWKRALCSP